MQVDLAAVLTALAGLVGAIGALWAIIKGTKKGDHKDSDEKAIAVSQVTETTAEVKTLREQVDFLFSELATLKLEKQRLEKKVTRLTKDLADERKDHRQTKLLLAETRKLLKEKTDQIKKLEKK